MIKITRLPCPNPKALANGNYKEEKNKAALKLSSHDKCMYCESKITHIDFGDVEHIKPKDKEKFPELEFVWENLGIACSQCNVAKLNHFYPEAPFIDPYTEDPSEHLFAHGSLLLHKQGSERGQITVSTVKLNRIELVEKRKTYLENIHTAIDAAHRTKIEVLRKAAIKELQNESSNSKEYSIFVKALLAANS